jgi:hypothetical protein
MESYEFLYNCVIQELSNNHLPHDLLTSLPLVSDQGSALTSFVRHRELKWCLCHRHLIEAAGASTLLGSWVARLLRCCCEAEYERVKAVIIEEVKLHYGDKGPYPPRWANLEMMLYPEGADFTHRIDRWARWYRIGCPTTSNAAESIHAKLNALKQRHQMLLGRIRAVYEYCQDRYNMRNSSDRRSARASNQFLKTVTGRKRHLILDSRDTGRLAFYTALNKPQDETEVIPNWTFPEHSLEAEIICVKQVVIENAGQVTLPDSWIPSPTAPVNYDKRKENESHQSTGDSLHDMIAESGLEGEDIPPESKDADGRFHDVAWDIILSMKALLPDWRNRLTSIISITMVIGCDVRTQADITTPVGEAAWRYRAYREAGVPIPNAPRMVEPAVPCPQAPVVRHE